ncbi:MAG: hypothetical protein LIR47_01635 [Spirochaetota bacterium]|nr:hypothetical protein [Spirochaetota bacterium]
MRKIISIVVCMLACSMVFAASFSSVEGKLFNDKSFIFPDDLLEERSVIIALTLSSSRKNGEEQQKHFIEWQKKLKETSSKLNAITVYHISVIDGAPFFVRGAIRNGIAKEYGELVQASQGGVLYLSKSERFASDARIPIDGEPTLVVLSATGSIEGFVKGAYSSDRMLQLQSLLGM